MRQLLDTLPPNEAAEVRRLLDELPEDFMESAPEEPEMKAQEGESQPDAWMEPNLASALGKTL